MRIVFPIEARDVTVPIELELPPMNEGLAYARAPASILGNECVLSRAPLGLIYAICQQNILLVDINNSLWTTSVIYVQVIANLESLKKGK